MNKRMDRHNKGENDLFSREAYRRSKLEKQLDEQENQNLETNWSDRVDEPNEDLSDYLNEETKTSENDEDEDFYYYEQRNSKPQTRMAHQKQHRQSIYRSNQEKRRGVESSPEKEATFTQSFKEDEFAERPAEKKMEQKTKKQKKKKHHWIRTILLLLLLIIGYCAGGFYLGQKDARKETSTLKPQAFNGVVSADGAKNILLIGNDSRDGENSRADTIMILSFAGKSKKPKLISIMRDSYVEIPGYNATKINAAYAYGGAELLRKTIKQNLGVDTKYYVTVDFQSFEKVVNALYPKGVKINAEKSLDLDGIQIDKGEQVMDGLKLLQYARFRHDEEGDFGRIRRQQQVMTAIFAQLKTPMAILRLPYAAGKALGYTANNIPFSYYAKIGFSMLRGASAIERLSVPVDSSWKFGTTSNGESVIYFDNDVETEAISKFLAQ